MSVPPRLRKPAQSRAAHLRGAANDCGRPTYVGVVLVAITNANVVRRAMGFDAWAGAHLAFVGSVKQTIGGGRVSQFAWDTVCLVFDAVTEDTFSVACARLAEMGSMSGDAAAFEFLAGAAIGREEIDALERAEQALADARQRGLSLFVGQSTDNIARGNVDLASDLALAVPRDEFFLVYQPKVNVRRRCVCSAEALIRWRHPVLGLVMPDMFIELADIGGEMRTITLWTLRRVITDQQRLTRAGQHLRIFVNISGGLLTDRIFIDAACALIETSNADIGFEITETAVIREPDLAIANLERCAEIGIALAIDDYGSGLSSLSYLKRLPATELKIDKMFITHLTSSHRDPLIVRSTIDLAHALDMEVTAEGVETPAALALLSVMGCEMVQGYLISQPLEIAAFEQYLAAYQFDSLQANEAPTVHRPASFWKRA